MATTPFNARDGLSVGVTPTVISDVNGNLTGASVTVSGNASAVNITASGTLSAGASTLASVQSTSNNLKLGNVTTPTDTTAIGGGLNLLGTTNKTLTWNSVANGWESSENINIATGLSYKIAGTSVLNSTTLGSGVANSSLTSVGTITTGNWNASLISGQFGGTGVNNAGKTITLGGNLVTSGAFNTTLTVSNTTNVTLPVSGTLATLAGTETLTGKTFNLTNNTLTATSAQLLAAIADATGTSSLVFATNPILVTPNIGTPSAGTLTNCSGLPYSGLTGIVPTWNQSTTGTANNSLSLGGSLAANYALLSNATYIGTTSIALNRTSLAQTLTGVSIDGNSATTTLAANSTNLGGVAAASYALTSSLSSYATLASPALTGTPTAPTANVGTNTTQIASTAFVQAALTPSTVSITTTGGATTLSNTQNQANAFEISGTLTSNAIIIVPNNMQLKSFENLTTGAFTLTIQTAAGTGSIIEQGAKIILYANGTNAESLAGLGYAQTYQAVTRASASPYTNPTGKPIITGGNTSGAAGQGYVTIVVNGFATAVQYNGWTGAANNFSGNYSLLIPPNATYTITATNCTLSSQYELR
jgi:hypothetical protein